MYHLHIETQAHIAHILIGFGAIAQNAKHITPVMKDSILVRRIHIEF